jgi:adenosine deaminase
MVFALAKRHGVALKYPTVGGAARGLTNFGNLQDFLDIYYAGPRTCCARPTISAR